MAFSFDTLSIVKS